MRYSFTNSSIETANSVLTVAATKDTITEITAGVKDLGDKVLVVASVTAVGEQVSLNLAAAKPKDWDGTPVTIGVKSSVFSAVISSLVHFGEDVYLDITDTVVKAGVKGKAEMTLDTVAELPQKIEGGEAMMQFLLKTNDLQSIVKKGLSTGATEIRENGSHNAVLSIDVSDGEGRGTVVGLSTTGHITSIAKGKVLLPTVKEGDEAGAARLAAMTAALDAYIEKTGQTKEALALVMPCASVKHLQTLVAGIDNVLFTVKEKYITVALGTVGEYTFRQNPKAPARASDLEAVVGADTAEGIKVGFDAATLQNAVSFINDMDKLDGTFGKKGVKLTASAKGMLMISGNGDRAQTSVKVTSGTGDAECMVNGALFRDALNVLDKGNVVVTFGNNIVKVSNGTVDEESSSGFAFVMKVVEDDDEEPEETTEAQADEGDSNTEPES